ncbi:MAG: L-threonylcarbamoyladenylate synthase [Hyphomicrobiaceae bacterium]
MSPVRASPQTIQEAAKRLKAGKLVAFPTETVYGLGADAANGRAVAALFAMKGRPRFNPLIVHAADAAAVERYALLDARARRLAEAFWPGPLTLVLPLRPQAPISDLVTAGLSTIAVRVPDHPVARALLEAAALPIAAPSANRSGGLSPTRAEHVAADFAGEPILILDGGPTVHGLESTILDASKEDIVQLRAGAVPADRISAVLGTAVRREPAHETRPLSPGQLASHYAPRAAVRLEATAVMPDEALLAFGGNVPSTCGPQFNLSPGGDPIEAAANLFAALRLLDAQNVKTIAVMPIPEHGLGEAINDRLRRAAAPRNGTVLA